MSKAKEYIENNIDGIYDKFCNWYEDDGSYDDHHKAQIVAEFQTVINLTLEDVKEAVAFEFDKECEDCNKQYTAEFMMGFLEAMRCAEIIVKAELKKLKL